ncbi:amino acid ABC transporter permease [Nonomuraea sp. KM88]|uniref:amino acid ABC transporter permease n=1 Tax=Nonomuraea sp. KM88 TaxID=3457427 RepID=UPI003FCC4F64
MFDFLDNPEYRLIEAFWTTIELTFYSSLGALVWGTILAVLRVSPVPVMRGFGTVYVNIVRNTPLTVIIAFTSLGLSSTLGINLAATESPTSLADNSFRLAVAGFTAYTATFVCEALRSGVNTIPVGQAEAARALGLSFFHVLTLIVLPQAFRSVVGPLTNVLIAQLKNTTIASIIGVAEASLLMSTMVENESDALFVVFGVFAAIFVALNLPLGLALGWLAKKVEVRR